HAAGVIIASKPLTEIAPLARNDEAIVVQYTKENIEAVGLLKFDFLGLRTMTVLRDTADMVRANHGVEIDYDRIGISDPKIYEMISRGDTSGVFQLESPGMTAFFKELKPKNLEDIIAGVSLYRPGPMDQIPRFVRGKNGSSAIHYDHPMLESILDVTYGCIVYQEQVMRIVRDLAGFSMGQADIVRRAMAKKKPEELAKYEAMFLRGGIDEKGRQVAGAIARGVDEKTASKIFAEVMAFAGYAFNKPHAAAYAVLAYQTAWLKYYYPLEFLAALLNSFLGDLAHASQYVHTAKKMGIEILAPDINRSLPRFSTSDSKILFALAAVKNVGKAVDYLVEERNENGPFTSFGDFLRRAYACGLRIKAVQSLILSSACDCLGLDRAEMMAVAENYFKQIANASRQTVKNQVSLFDISNSDSDREQLEDEPSIPEGISPYSRKKKLDSEKEYIGIYVTGHPLDDYRRQFDSGNFILSAALDKSRVNADLQSDDETDLGISYGAELHDGAQIRMAGLLLKKRSRSTRNDRLMAILEMEDIDGSFEVIVFPQILDREHEKLQESQVLMIEGRLSIRDDFPSSLLADRIEIMPTDAEHFAKAEGDEGFRRDRDRSSKLEMQDAVTQALDSFGEKRPQNFDYSQELYGRLLVIDVEALRPELLQRLEQFLSKLNPGHDFISLYQRSRDVLHSTRPITLSAELLESLTRFLPAEHLTILGYSRQGD
ncbi:MAG: DNA polymerase III subunit alpha, partial [Eubacteriales bacterium]|nr:DNA polymerase III subunit alpha [Eubacteriales bacterium]